MDLETALCLCNVQRTIEQSVYMEVSQGVFIASVAEDIFFVLRDKTLARALDTMSGQALLATCTRTLETLAVSAPAPSLYRTVSTLPDAPCEQALLRSSLESFRRSRLKSVRTDEKRGERKEGEAETRLADSFSSLVETLACEMEEITEEIDTDAAEALLSLVIAANSADAVSVSIGQLQAFMGEVIRDQL